jgi:hypothetical protein
MRSLIGGGTDGNEQLTAMTGVVLLILLAALGVTILRIGQLIWLHLFLGLALIGPIVAKLASTGYRFVRYYTGDLAYRGKGPPRALMRAIAPLVVASTLVVFVTGILLLLDGPSGRDSWLLAHKVSFFVWLGATALHVLGHLAELPHSLRATNRRRRLSPVATRAPDTDGRRSPLATGEPARWIALAGAVAAGLILALVLIPEFASWTAHGAIGHHRG